MSTLMPLNLKGWIDEHRHLLKPPVGNQCVWKDRDFIVMIVGGPNARKDYHVNPTEELFYQVEGDITLRIIENGTPRDIPIRQGDIFLLPPGIPHSPQRPANTVGMVVERQRPAGQPDHLRFYCEKCGGVIHEPEFDLKDIVNQLKVIMEEFWKPENAARRTCKKCGTTMAPPAPAR
ncbi:3-hydroxyanthranilate 3,4-dioxygenase [Phycisphaerae bacterium RAS1]|nr:3-hydroxyanthranilate 3,4-dioxygenase [Phycisphaerae bacterium RAS1]